jgi:hypothetical protein
MGPRSRKRDGGLTRLRVTLPRTVRPTGMKRMIPVSVLLALGAVAGVVAVSSSDSPAKASPPPKLTQARHSTLEMSTIATCLRKQGWEITVDAQGAIESSVDFDHAAALDAAYQRCDADFLAAHPRPVMDETAWTKLYKHQLLLVGCLRDHGYPPVQKTPSLADYVAAGHTPSGPAFYAWSAVGGVGMDQLAELERDCPQAPPDL